MYPISLCCIAFFDNFDTIGTNIKLQTWKPTRYPNRKAI